MNKTTGVFAWIVVTLLAVPPASSAQSSLTRVRKLNEPRTITVALEFSKKDRSPLVRIADAMVVFEPNAHASGFLVREGLVMTAFHVVSGKLSASKKQVLGFRPDDELEVKVQVNGCSATVVKVDAQADLALLRICDRSKVLPPSFGALPSDDEPLLLIARPGDQRLIRSGHYSGVYAVAGQQYWSARIDGEDGFSGSPVYNIDGELVGVFCLYDWTRKIAVLSPTVKAQQFLAAYDAEVQFQK